MEGDSDASGGESGHRYMVEDIAVTPFFKRHGSHMAATIKLHAEVREEGDSIVLEAGIPGYSEEDVDVSATPNTIDVTLVLEKKESGDVRFHSSYFTPVPIDDEHLRVEHEGGVLTVTASKR
jgi:HSP20 family molecular chaperone IbpA